MALLKRSYIIYHQKLLFIREPQTQKINILYIALSMSRWEYDTVFYRLFCITLLGIAFTFTVILTNVFVDIDGLLTTKDKVITTKAPPKLELSELSRVINVNMLPEDKSGDTYDDNDYPDSNDLYRNKRSLDHRLVIKTIKDITSLANDQNNKENDGNAMNKVNGITRVINKGKSIQFNRIDDESNNNDRSVFDNNIFKVTANTELYNDKHISKNQAPDSNKTNTNQRYYHKIFHDYVETLKSDSESSKKRKMFSRKRHKRHIKIRYNNNKTTAKPKSKKDDDELFVEIETHFDSNGTKGEKKKKMIRDLIEKIQNAIRFDNNTHKKQQKHWHVKKRMQNPLSSRSAASLLNKLMIPIETFTHRRLDPISKAVKLHEEIPIVSNPHGHDYWEKSYNGPGFFGKNINSAEMNTADIDYNKVMKHNGIPQRLQKPLNTDMSDEVFQDTQVVDLGNIKFLIKDIDGSGFSIGFNQYTDEAPDAETMKLFSGLENIIQAYHQQYDEESTYNHQQNDYDHIQSNMPMDDNQDDELIERTDQHVIQRRSIQSPYGNQHISNRYRINYNHNLDPNKNNDVFKNSKIGYVPTISNIKLYKNKNSKESSFIIDENIFKKNLRPSEILSIADLFSRKKRSLTVKKISNVNIKQKMNRYLNTKKLASKSLFLNKKKRHKRQIDKIKIIARDIPLHRNSEEDNIFLVSDEKIFTDRAFIREVEVPEIEPNDKAHSIEQHFDMISPQKVAQYNILDDTPRTNEEHFDIIGPYVYETSPFESHNDFSRRARHNSLMSKYPHIIMEETPISIDHGEEIPSEYTQPQNYNTDTTMTPTNPTMIDIPTLNDSDMTELITPPKDLSNYRVSVKIRPKNSTGMSGFKEVHTSINKSYNKNGLMYTSLVNVSQLSKVEKVNKTSTRRDNERTLEQNESLKQQQEVIKNLILKHKQRLDDQLKHLRLERLKLETMDLDEKNIENISESIPRNTNIPNIPTLDRKLNKESDVTRKKSKHEGIAAKKLKVTTEATTKTVTTSTYMPLTDDNAVKTKLLQTIEKNENITDELLKKIDQNTDVLKMFLSKLVSSLEIPARKAIEEKVEKHDTDREIKNYQKSNNYQQNNDNTYISNQPLNNKNDFSTPMDINHNPFNFGGNNYIPNTIFRNMQKTTNNSYGIPFIYAVQHPYGSISNTDKMASLVYHGHIHTNTLDDNNINTDNKNSPPAPIKGNIEKKVSHREFWNPKPGEKVIHDFVISKNSSKFFLDEAENDFKMPMLDGGNSTKAVN